jgi:hypothetical protein
VLLEGTYGDFIRTEGLQVAWHGSISDLVVLVRPGMLESAKAKRGDGNAVEQ